MSKESSFLSEIGLFLVGVAAAGFLSDRRRESAAGAPSAAPADPASTPDWKSAVAALESRVASQQAATTARFGQMESRLAELPTTSQIVGAMEQLMAKTMNSLDERLTAQAHSIEVLKTTVSQTDSLLERVLESLDSLQNYAAPIDLTEDTLLQRQAG